MKFSLLITFYLLITFSSFGQSTKTILDNLARNLDDLNKNKQKTSVYIRTNKGIYETGEDLWFKSYILNKSDLTPSTLDSILYIQLSSIKEDNVVWQEKYKISNGFSDGHVFINTNLISGDYYLKAYTKNSFNSLDSIHSVRKIKIISSLKSEEVQENTRVENQETDKVFLNFYPEGGYLINGIESKVAFKVNNIKGVPQNISCTLYEDDEPLIKFKTAYFGIGMGSFRFIPDISKTYYVKIGDKVQYKSKVFQLPKILSKGITLQKLYQSDTSKVSFKVKGNIGDSRIYIRAQSRGNTIAMASAFLRDSVIVTLPTKDFPHGISEITLFDNEFKPRAERLVFLNNHKKLYITTKLSKETFKTREKVTLKIKVTNFKNQPLKTNLVLSIYDAIYHNPQDSKNIITNYSLSTQLKGIIYNPTNYFNLKNKKRKEGLELLMLVNGWRSYVWNEQNLKQKQSNYLLKEGIYGKLKTIKKEKNAPEQLMIAIINPKDGINNKNYKMLNKNMAFHLKPKDLENGNHFYIKHFGNNRHKILINTIDGFDIINKFSLKKIKYPEYHSVYRPEKSILGYRTDNKNNLDEVTIKAKKGRVFRDKYLGSLDSILKLNLNTDYVCSGNYLNCEIHFDASDNKPPIEGENYIKRFGFKWIGDNGAYTAQGESTIIYQYPKYTEKELLNRFNILRVKGYYNKKDFFSPNYDEFNDPHPDYRNTLYWNPNIITDENGEATISFYCSDINTRFIGILEGIDDKGLLGTHNFEFYVTKSK